MSGTARTGQRRVYTVSASFVILAHSLDEADEIAGHAFDSEFLQGGGWSTVETDEWEDGSASPRKSQESQGRAR